MFRIPPTWQPNEQHNETNQGLIIWPSSLSLPSWSPFIHMWHTSSSWFQHLVRLCVNSVGTHRTILISCEKSSVSFCSGMYQSGFQRAGSSITSPTEQKCDGTRWVGVWGDGGGALCWDQGLGRSHRKGRGVGGGRQEGKTDGSQGKEEQPWELMENKALWSDGLPQMEAHTM